MKHHRFGLLPESIYRDDLLQVHENLDANYVQKQPFVHAVSATYRLKKVTVKEKRRKAVYGFHRGQFAGETEAAKVALCRADLDHQRTSSWSK